MNAIEELIEADAIRRLRVHYSHFFDGNRLDELVELFTDDAVCEFGADYGGDWVGKAEIRARFAKIAERHGPDYGVLHAVTNHDVRFIDATNAHGRAYLLDLRTTEGVENPLILFGIYDDLYRKVDGAWKIHRTRIDFLWPRRRYLGPRAV